MTIRAAIIFVYGVFLLRLAPARSIGKSTAFDIVFAVVVGSTLSRALTANAEMLPTMAAAGVLVLLHVTVARLALHSDWFGRIAKGDKVQVVDNGEVDRRAMRSASLTERDLMEGLRAEGGLTEIGQVEAAFLERSGAISVIPYRSS